MQKEKRLFFSLPTISEKYYKKILKIISDNIASNTLQGKKVMI